MPCTTILIGKHASYDGSTIMARNEDSPNGVFEPKRMAVVEPADQPRTYVSELAHFTMPLPDDPMRYTSVPDVLPGHGVWAEAGFNTCDVAMTATETITTNERVLGADPLVEYVPAKGHEGDPDYVPARPGGLGEEDLVTVVLPYVTSAREGVRRLGALLEEYGTYEANGIGFSDADEIWWLETIGGHHWIAKRVPDDAYVTMPNQLGIDSFDLADAEGEQKDHMCSADLRRWMAENHLDLTLRSDDVAGCGGAEGCCGSNDAGDAVSADVFNPREAFGSHSDSDHVYNTPRAWCMQRFLNPSDVWDGADADFGPEDDDIPWSRVPERKLTIEDVKYVLSAHYQGTPFDCYGTDGTSETRGRYRPIGINRNSQLAVLQLRPYAPQGCRAIQWMAFGSNPFNALVPLYANVDSMPAYLEGTTATVSTESFYWTCRLIAALADARFHDNGRAIEDYQLKMGGMAHRMLAETDRSVAAGEAAPEDVSFVLARANEQFCDELRRETDALLGKVLYTTSCAMKNGFAMSDNLR